MLRFPRLAVTLVAAVALASTVAGCGTDDDGGAAGTTQATDTSTTTSTTEAEADTRPIDEWGSELCGALTDWNDGLESIGSQFEHDVEGVDAGDVPAVRDLLTDLFGDASERTDDLGVELEQLGQPDLDRGEEIATEVRKGVSKVQGELTSLKNVVADLPDDMDRQAFSDELDRLNADFQENIDEIAATFEDFEASFGDDGAALDEVFAEEPACEGLAT